MPELPEVENVRRSLLPHLAGRSIEKIVVREPRLRWPVDRRGLKRWTQGARVDSIRRRAKYLLVDLDRTPRQSAVLMIHLGMTGRVGLAPVGKPLEIHTHVVFGLDNGRELRFVDPRRFGMVEAFAAAGELDHPRLAHLGLEPLEPSTTAAALAARAKGRTAPIKSFLMDARQVVGVGNIYACEALWAAGIHPQAAAGRLSRARWERLTRSVQELLSRAIESGGTTFRDYQDADGRRGEFAASLAVYGREGLPCPACAKPVRRLVQGGRSTFYCARCQRV